MPLSNCTNSIIERLHYLSVYKISCKCYQNMLLWIWKQISLWKSIHRPKLLGTYYIKIIFNLLIIDHTYHFLISALPKMCKKDNWSACTYGIVFQIISKHFLFKLVGCMELCIVTYSHIAKRLFAMSKNFTPRQYPVHTYRRQQNLVRGLISTCH